MNRRLIIAIAVVTLCVVLLFAAEHLTENRGVSYIPYGRNRGCPGRNLDIYAVDGAKKEGRNFP